MPSPVPLPASGAAAPSLSQTMKWEPDLLNAGPAWPGAAPAEELNAFSPTRPPVSPITPSAGFAHLQSTSRPDTSIIPPPPVESPARMDTKHPTPAHQPQHTASAQTSLSQPPPQANFISPPDAVGFEFEENTDVMALRAAITILELQKERCQRDFKTLNQLKQTLKDDPEKVIDEFVKGNMRPPPRPSNPHLDALPYDELDEADDEEGGAESEDTEKPTLPHLPPMQKIARCPPVNWAKYQVVGSVLDKMHDEQLRRPAQGEPLHGPLPYAGDPSAGDMSSFSGPPGSEHHVFKAYDELDDGPPRPQTVYQAAPSPAPVGVSTRRKSRK